MPHSIILKSVDETAVARNWPPKRVRKLIAEGLPVVTIGRQKFVNSETLDQFLRDREEPILPNDHPSKNMNSERNHGDGCA